MPQTATFSQEALIAEIEATRRYLAGLENSLLALTGKVPESAGSKSQQNHGDLRVWKAVRSYLLRVKRPASYHELARELASAGTPLGTFPLRTIAQAAVQMKKKGVFELEKNGKETLVRLVEPNITALIPAA